MNKNRRHILQNSALLIVLFATCTIIICKKFNYFFSLINLIQNPNKETYTYTGNDNIRSLIYVKRSQTAILQ